MDELGIKPRILLLLMEEGLNGEEEDQGDDGRRGGRISEQTSEEVRGQPMNELSEHKPSRLQYPKMDKNFHPFIQCLHDPMPCALASVVTRHLSRTQF